MGNSTSQSDHRKFDPETILEEAAKLFCGNFYYGSGRHTLVISSDMGMVFCDDFRKTSEDKIEIDGYMRLSSWFRQSPLYPLALSLSKDGTNDDTVVAIGLVRFNGPGGGWENLVIEQNFKGKFYLNTMTFSGSWWRNEARTSAGMQETMNTGGSFSLTHCGSVVQEVQSWSPSSHRFYLSHDEFRQTVKIVLMMHARKDCIMSKLPRDIVYMLIQELGNSLLTLSIQSFSQVLFVLVLVCTVFLVFLFMYFWCC